MGKILRFITLGPDGSCHSNAVKEYIKYQKIPDAEIRFTSSFIEGLEMVHDNQGDYLVQCSSHPQVNIVTEKYHEEIQVVDTFVFHTQEIALLERRDVEKAISLGLVPLCEGYLGDITYLKHIYEYSKPMVGKGLLNGKYDAGITYYNYYLKHPDQLSLRKRIGKVLCTWIVFGRETWFGETIQGLRPQGDYNQE